MMYRCLIFVGVLLWPSLSGLAQPDSIALGLPHTENEGLRLEWTGGEPPFLLESSVDLGQWHEVGQFDERTALVSPEGFAQLFYRVRSFSGRVSVGDFVGQLRVDEGEFGPPLAKHRLKSLWDFYHPQDGVISRVPHEFFRNLIVSWTYLEGQERRLYQGRLEDLPEASLRVEDRTMRFAWQLGSGRDLRNFELLLEFRYSVRQARSVIHLSDPTYKLTCDYVVPQPEATFGAQLGFTQTRQDEVALYELSDMKSPAWWRRHVLVTANEISVRSRFEIGVPNLQGGPAFIWKTPILKAWSGSTVSGLLEAPFIVRDRFSQTYQPGHHNFVETVWIEPLLSEDLEPAQRSAIEALGIRYIVVTQPSAFPGQASSLYLVDADLQVSRQ